MDNAVLIGLSVLLLVATACLYATRGEIGTERSWVGGLCFLASQALLWGLSESIERGFAWVGGATLLWLLIRITAMVESSRRAERSERIRESIERDAAKKKRDAAA